MIPGRCEVVGDIKLHNTGPKIRVMTRGWTRQEKLRRREVDRRSKHNLNRRKQPKKKVVRITKKRLEVKMLI